MTLHSHLIAGVCFIVTSVIHSSVFAQQADRSRPNIIFILTDDLGWGDVGVFYQNERAKAKDAGAAWMFTPHLDEMASEGAQLPHHYCAAPVCAPSRASILLGVSQGHANVRDNQFDKALEENHTMPSVLREAGYATAAIGKWGLQGGSRYGTNWPAHPLNRGFDYFLGYIRHVDGHEHYPKEGVYRGPKEVWENRTNIADGLDKCYTADLWTAAAKRWIVSHRNGANGDAPFFMYLAFDTPHAVLELPTQPYPEGGGIKGGLQWLGKEGRMINTASGEVDGWMHPDYANATYDHDGVASTANVPWPETYKRYATSVRRIDNALGDIMQLLKDLKIDSHTLVVFTSDNGPSLESYLGPEHVKYNPAFFQSFGPFDGVKRDCWEGGVRMPTLAHWPARIRAGSVVDYPSASYDWLPTFTDAAGLPAPARSDGVTLLPSLTGEGKQVEKPVYVEYFNNGATPDIDDFAPDRRKRRRRQMQMIRIGDYAGVRYDIQSHADDFEIYHVVDDPGQSQDRAQSKETEGLQQEMKDRVLRMRMPDDDAPRPYDDELIPAVENRNGLRQGLSWRAYEGNFFWVPDVTGMTADDTGQADRVSTDVVKDRRNGVLLFEGYLRIPADGVYTFHFNADTGGLLRIHDALVIDADYGYRGGSEVKGSIRLKAGMHPVKLWYMMQQQRKPALTLRWEGPGIALQEVSRGAFHHEP